MSNIRAIVSKGHVAHFQNADGVNESATAASGVVKIPSERFTELEALGAVKRAPRDPLDHDGDGVKGGVKQPDSPAQTKVEDKK